MSNDKEYMDAMVPVELENGKTIWTKVGTAFPNNDPEKRHEMLISLTAVPLSMFNRDEIKIFVFPQRNQKQKPHQREFNSTRNDDDVKF